MTEIVCPDGRWWRPAYDVECVPAVLREVARVPEYLARVPSHRRGLCVQAGGNVGIWAERLAEEFDTVVTFEADPLNFLCLRRNIRADNVEPWPCGLWDRLAAAKTVKPAGEEANCGAVQVRPMKTGTPLLPLDYMVTDRVDLLLLDIEGAELPALRGAVTVLQESRPTVALELKGLGRAFGYEDREVFEWLAGIGYREAARIGRDVVFVPC